MSTATRSSLKIGLLPADGIGHEVIPVCPFHVNLQGNALITMLQAARDAILALGSTIPKPEFISLNAGFEYFTKKGVALPEESIECVVLDFDA